MALTMAQLATFALNDPDRLGFILASQGYQAPTEQQLAQVSQQPPQQPMLGPSLSAQPPAAGPRGFMPVKESGMGFPTPAQPPAEMAPPLPPRPPVRPGAVPVSPTATSTMPVPPRKPTPPGAGGTPAAGEGDVWARVQEALAGVDTSQLQTPQDPAPPRAPSIQGGRPQASQLQDIIAMLAAQQMGGPAVPTLGQLIRGG